jgi:hypothetical protein
VLWLGRRISQTWPLQNWTGRFSVLNDEHQLLCTIEARLARP